ncbi:MAG TPA: hypothetical protein ENJ20_03740, partial [Bacteroidetes bacterium]|nr:hypothetical protein [Bacteroidota bacterium]
STGPACLGANAIAGFVISLPDIQPGDAVVVNWDSYTCTTGTCSSMELNGWTYSLAYTDMCNSNSYSKSGTGQAAQTKNVTIFAESPSDLSDGQTGEYVYILSSATFDLPEGSTPYFKVVFDVPDGLVWSGNSSDLTYVSGQTAWSASSISFSSSTDQLTAIYDLPVPFTLSRSEFKLNLTLDCSVPNVNGSATVGMQLFYGMDGSCPTPYEIPLTCLETATTYLHCPGTCTEGLNFQSFTIERTTFGQPDNNRDGLADSSGSIDENKVKKNRMMVSDQFTTTFTGTVKTSGSYPSWSYGYASSDIPHGDLISIQSAAVTITDSSTGNTLTCSNVSYTESLANSVRTVNFDFSPATLAANGCSDFNNFTLDEGDAISLVATYKVTGNPGASIEQVQITNDFYVSPSANGTAFQCNDWNGNFTLIGYAFSTGSSENYVIKTCEKTINESFYLSIGDCCTNYAGGDYFPYEYRNWGIVKNLRVVLPDGYTLVSASMDYYRTQYTNSSVLEEVDLTASSVSGQTYQFDLSSYFTTNGGTLNPGDDGFNGTVSLVVKPACTATQNSYKDMNWYFTFLESSVLGGSATDEYNSAADRLKYRRGSPAVSATNQTVDGVGNTVSWDITVSNSVAAADNTWLFPFSPNGAMNIVSVVDLSDNSTITPSNGFYQLGDFSKNQSGNYRITANFNSCAASALKVYSGYDCEGYPTNLGNFTCGYNEYALYVSPQPSELQLKTTNNFDAQNPCSSTVSMEVELLSAKLGAVKNIEVDVKIPASQSITLVNGSVQKKYPESGSFTTVATPTLNGTTYTIVVNDIDSTINADGLVGITDVTANKLTLRMDMLLGSGFVPGDYVQVDVRSQRICGDTMSPLSVAFDPNAVFVQASNVGLSSAGDSWACAWGDYNSDGYPDLFVVSNDLNASNELYLNDGDGTFTQINSGSIVTDTGPSTAASWADYDNDGDLDLYVGNNIGYLNYLYRNEGGGTFTKIENDPIVSDYGYTHGVSWVDYDNDGYLDLFAATYWESAFNLLYHNNGDGTFTKVTNNVVVNESSRSVMGVWADYDNDGWPDLFVANNNNQNNSLYHNIGNGNFEKITTGDIVNDGGNSVGASWGDYNNDGYLDLFVANSTSYNFLYKNNGDGTFTKITSGAVVADEEPSHGSSWADYDGDGYLDLFVTNDGQDNNLYRNNGDGTFKEIDNDLTQDGDLSFGTAWADYDADGDVDLYVANRAGTENLLFENGKGSCLNWSCIKLVGTRSNKSAIGAHVFAYANIYGQALTQMREVTAMSGGGIGGQNELTVHFGMGNASIIDSIVVLWPSGYRQVLTNQSLNQCITITEDNASEVCGSIYYDANANCTEDSGEVPVPGTKIELTPGNIIGYADANGDYSVYAKPGTYTITVTPGSNWSALCPNVQGTSTVTVVGIGNQYCGNDFGLNASCALPDLKTEIATTAHRIGFENLLVVDYENQGGSTSTGITLSVTFPSAITPREYSTSPDSYNNSVATWSLGNLTPGQKGAVYVTYLVADTTTIGRSLQITSSLTGNESDCDATNDSYTETSAAVGAFDPNDILVHPEGVIQRNEWLYYKIRFQNMGNTPASLVRVEDVLPEQLDLSTFEMGTASHTYEFQADGRQFVWTFPNINLPDSLTNEPESHGFVTFRIKPRSDLSVGDRILNRAVIYFDLMEPVKTNTVENIFGNDPAIAPKDDQGLLLHIHPNPTRGEVTVQSLTLNLEPDSYFTQIKVLDFFSQPVLEINNPNSQRVRFSLSGIPSGSYLVQARDNKNRIHYGKVVVWKK